jgi:hypothetical protein
MSEKRSALEPVLNKLEKLCSMVLGSDNRDEVATAAMKMQEILKSVGIHGTEFWQLGWAAQKDNLADILAMMMQKDRDKLFNLTIKAGQFFRNDAVYVDVKVHGRRHTFAVGSVEFAEWLIAQACKQMKSIVSRGDVKTVAEAVAAHIKHEPGIPWRTVHQRAVEHGGRIYIDMGDAERRVIEVRPDGWDIIDDGPSAIRFVRTSNMRSLPTPERAGSFDQLRPLLAVTDAGFELFKALLLDFFRDGKHPVGGAFGPGGSGKSSLALAFKRFTDPEKLDMRMPRTLMDFRATAARSRAIPFDNMSKLTAEMSDEICRVSDSFGSAQRKFFTQTEESCVGGPRSVFLTSIENDLVVRADLASRLVRMPMQGIIQRMSDAEFKRRLNEVAPRVFAAVLDALAVGLQNLPDAQVSFGSRLPDFELWAACCEPAHATKGIFAAAFRESLVAVNDELIDDSPVAQAILAFMGSRKQWPASVSDPPTNTPTALWNEILTLDRNGKLMDVATIGHDGKPSFFTKQKCWPGDAGQFSKVLRANDTQSVLLKAGIKVNFHKSSKADRTKTVSLEKMDTSDASDASSPNISAAVKEQAARREKAPEHSRPSRPSRPRSNTRKTSKRRAKSGKGSSP